GVREEVIGGARVPPGFQMLVVGGEGRVLQALEVDGLEPLPVDAGQEVEIVRVDGTVAELFHPVALELEEPAEGEIRVDEPAVEPAPDERAEPVQPRETGHRAQGAEAVAAPRGGIGGGKL